MANVRKNERIGSFPYRIMDWIGGGGMADVYLAVHELTKQNVVIKIAQSDDKFHVMVFTNEALMLQKLKHPGVVQIHPIDTFSRNADFYVSRADGLKGRPPFLVMEHLRGGSLTQMLNRPWYKLGNGKRALPITLALYIATEIANTLAYVHAQKTVHLDLKPDNILFRTPFDVHGDWGIPQPVLIDFGIARYDQVSGLEAGTDDYIAPERIPTRNSVVPDPAPYMDIYAFGVVLYQMLTSDLPFRRSLTQRFQLTRNARRSTERKLRSTPPVAPSKHLSADLPIELTEQLDSIVLSCLDYDPANRPSSADIHERILSLVRRYNLIYHQSGPSSPPPSQPWRNTIAGHLLWRGGRIVGVFLILLAILGVLYLARNILPSEIVSMPTLTQNWELDNGIEWLRTAQDGLCEVWPCPRSTSDLNPTSLEEKALDAETSTPTVTSIPTAQIIMSTPVPDIAVMSTPVPEIAIAPTQTSTYTPTDRPRFIEIPTIAPTSTQRIVPTSTPVPNLKPTNTPTSIPPTPTQQRSTLPPASQSMESGGNSSTSVSCTGKDAAVTLVTPMDGATASESQTFEWISNFRAQGPCYYQVILWKSGQIPFTDGLGAAQETQATSQTIHLARLVELDSRFPPGEYFWGVMLRSRNGDNSEKVKYLGGGWRLTVP